jgi:hypothetical protein
MTQRRAEELKRNGTEGDSLKPEVKNLQNFSAEGLHY